MNMIEYDRILDNRIAEIDQSIDNLKRKQE